MHATQREPGNRHLKRLGLTKSVVARAYILTLCLLDNQTLLRGPFHGLASWQERADIHGEDSRPGQHNPNTPNPQRSMLYSTHITAIQIYSILSCPRRRRAVGLRCCAHKSCLQMARAPVVCATTVHPVAYTRVRKVWEETGSHTTCVVP